MRALAVLGLALALTPAQAFVRLRIGNGGPAVRRSDATNVQFLINELTAPGLANTQGATIITADSDPLGALQGAMDGWTNVETSNVAFATPGRTRLRKSSALASRVPWQQTTTPTTASRAGSSASHTKPVRVATSRIGWFLRGAMIDSRVSRHGSRGERIHVSARKLAISSAVTA